LIDFFEKIAFDAKISTEIFCGSVSLVLEKERLYHSTGCYTCNNDLSCLGNLLTDTKRYDEAEEHYEKAVELSPDDFRTHYNFAIFLREMKRIDEAEKHYRRALEIEPDFLQAYINLGNLLTEIKRYDEAEEYYKKALEIDPNDARIHYNYARMLREISRDRT